MQLPSYLGNLDTVLTLQMLEKTLLSLSVSLCRIHKCRAGVSFDNPTAYPRPRPAEHPNPGHNIQIQDILARSSATDRSRLGFWN